MATFAEYQAQTMASNDFTLYPYQDMWNHDQSYLSTTPYPDQTYLNSTSYDSYSSQPAYAQAEHYTFGHDQALHAKNTLNALSPNYSPSNSATHSFDIHNPPILSSTSDSGASVQSTISSTMGSPSVQPQHSSAWHQPQSMLPEILQPEMLTHDVFGTSSFGFDSIPVTDKGCVDPSLIQPTFSPTQLTGAQFTEIPTTQSPQPMGFTRLPSSMAPVSPVHSEQQTIGKARRSVSPYMQPFQPYPTYNGSRRQSMSSMHSRHSQGSISSEDANKGLCPIPTCGRHVKDLKAHMLTHQNERPEKCPIPTCEYHTKGFARKYDKNRHTLTHYKGTMVCGFCPGSGSAAEKSFNRADVFKRHLTSVHGVEQTPPNARRKSPAAVSGKRAFGRDVSGMCSTCGVTFASAQDFYEHLDDCVLRVVQQTDPSEAINQKLLESMADDEQVQDTMEKHMLTTNVDYNAATSFEEEEEAEDEEEEGGDEDETNDSTYGSRSGKSGKGSIKNRKTATNNAS